MPRQSGPRYLAARGVAGGMNWPRFMRLLAGIRGRWDLAILANLAEGRLTANRLLDAINEQAGDGHRLTWKVMRDSLRHLEEAGYVGRCEVRRFPRETHYWATDFARRLIAKLDTLDAWYTANAPGPGGHCQRDGHHGRAADIVAGAACSPPSPAPGVVVRPRSKLSSGSRQSRSYFSVRTSSPSKVPIRT